MWELSGNLGKSYLDHACLSASDGLDEFLLRKQYRLPCGVKSFSLPSSDMDENLLKLKELFPKLTDDELVIAQENIDRYLEVIWDIWQDEKSRNATGFDESHRPAYDDRKVDSPNK